MKTKLQTFRVNLSDVSYFETEIKLIIEIIQNKITTLIGVNFILQEKLYYFHGNMSLNSSRNVKTCNLFAFILRIVNLESWDQTLVAAEPVNHSPLL